MSNLKIELEKYWLWYSQKENNTNADIEYLKINYDSGYTNNNNELQYAEWDKLDNIVYKEIDKLEDHNFNDELVNLLMESINIDYEEGNFIFCCFEKINIKNIELFFIKGINSKFPNTRVQFIENLKDYEIHNREEILIDLIETEKNKTIKRVALISLSEINICRSEIYAFKNIKDDDDFIRLVSLIILKNLKSNYLEEANALLKDDKFTFIQNELVRI